MERVKLTFPTKQQELMAFVEFFWIQNLRKQQKSSYERRHRRVGQDVRSQRGKKPRLFLI